MNSPLESISCFVVVLLCVAVGARLLHAAWSQLIDR